MLRRGWASPAYCLFNFSLYCTFFHTYSFFAFHFTSLYFSHVSLIFPFLTLGGHFIIIYEPNFIEKSKAFEKYVKPFLPPPPITSCHTMFSISGHPSLELAPWALMGPWYFRGYPRKERIMCAYKYSAA